MNRYRFNENELSVVGYIPNHRRPGEPGRPVLNYPCTPKEAINAMYRGESVWLPYGVEESIFCPEIIPDNIARGFVIASESGRYTVEDFGGPDMFGVEWLYETSVHGAIEKPGNGFLLGEEVYGWKEKLRFPDIDSWDWDRSARENKTWLNNGKANIFWLLNGMGFERLISFMGFEGAAMAMLDEDQEDDLQELLTALTDLYIRLVDRVVEAYGDGIDGFTLHDDWGSQTAPLFSEGCADKFFVPQMKRFTDHVKAKGKFADLHSCGYLEERIASFIRSGWQSWTPMPINDTLKLQKMYGDRIIIGCVPDYDPERSAEDNAAEFVKRYYRPERPCTISHYGSSLLSEAYVKAIYKFSREMGADR